MSLSLNRTDMPLVKTNLSSVIMSCYRRGFRVNENSKPNDDFRASLSSLEIDRLDTKPKPASSDIQFFSSSFLKLLIEV